MNGEVVDKVIDVMVELFSGEVLDVVRAVAVVPRGNDDQFS